MFFRLIFAVTFLLVFQSCKKEELVKIEVWGHGATGLSRNDEFPENSLPAIKKAWYHYGVDGIELDIQLSKDGTLWLFHDEFLEAKTTGEGCINSLEDDYLEQVSYRDVQGFYRDVKLIRLDDALGHMPMKVQVMLDIKTYNFCTEQSIDESQLFSALEQLDDEWGEKITFYYVSKRGDILLELKDRDYKNIFVEKESYADAIQFALNYNFEGIILKSGSVSELEVKEAQDAGLKVMLFEFRSISGVKNAAAKKPDYLLSDHLKIIK